MFSGFQFDKKAMLFSGDDSKELNSEDAHYEEHEDTYANLDDGISLDDSIVDEYEEFDDEMENDTPEPLDSEYVLKNDFIDEVEAEHYDSLEDE